MMLYIDGRDGMKLSDYQIPVLPDGDVLQVQRLPGQAPKSFGLIPSYDHFSVQ